MFHRLPSAANVAILLLCVCFSFTSLWHAPYCRADDTQVHIGVLAKRGAIQCLKRWTPTAQYLTDCIPNRVFVILPLQFEEIYDAVARERVSFIFCNPAFYVELEIKYGANRIVTLKNRYQEQGFTRYGGVVFTRRDRLDIRRWEDLKGKRLMGVEENSLGGWLAVWRELHDRGVNPYRYFGDLQFGETHDRVIYAVRKGSVDVGTVRTDTLERMLGEGKIAADEFYVIGSDHDREDTFPFQRSTRLYPEWPLAKTKQTPDALAKAVVRALLDMSPEDPAAVAAQCAGWTIPHNYQPVHDCLKALRVGPYRDLGKVSLADVIRNYWRWMLTLAVLFVSMLAASLVILKLNRHLKHSQRELEAEVKERQRAEKAAEAATQAKSEFLASMSHEIRNPMNGVIVAADLALDEALSPKIERYMKIIHASAYSLLGIINDLLDFSKIEAGKLELEKQPFRLDQVLGRVMDMFLERAVEKKIELLVDIDPDVPQNLIGDALRVQQILTNLISNAVKFTDNGGVILAGVQSRDVSPDRATLELFVKDTGIGISAEQKDKLFRPFSQADKSTARKYGGTGLGLSICKQLVSLMEGEIWVDSELGQGSTFRFSARFDRQPPDQEKKIVPPAVLSGRVALIVDDCADSRQILKKLLSSWGLTVLSADSGAHALHLLTKRQAQDQSVDLIIMDWLMPAMDGMAASQTIRQELQMEVPIIMLTAFGSEKQLTLAQETGINGFLTKPFRAAELLDAVRDALGLSPAHTATPAAHAPPHPSLYRDRLRGLRVLVAEDNPTNQEVVRAVLEKAGVSAVLVANGQEAVDTLDRQTFDAVMMDIEMPVMNGYEATRIIRKDERFASLPIIAMTGHAMKGDEEKCLRAGMDGYASKPINQERLFQTLWQLARSHPHPGAAELKDIKPLETAATEPVALPAHLPGIQIEEALRALNIDSGSLKNILVRFFHNNRHGAAKIRNTYEARHWEALRQLAHSLKGSAANIRAEKLSGKAHRLEAACTESPSTPPPSSLVADVEDALDEVLQSLSSILPSKVRKATAAPTQPINEKHLKNALDALTDALKRSDPAAVEQHLEAARPHLPPAVFQTLEGYIRNYDYDQAVQFIRSIANLTDQRLAGQLRGDSVV